MALPLAITRITQTSGLLRIAAAGATAVLVLSIQLSGSRIGVFAACVGVAVLLILIPRFRTRIVIALAVFGLAAIVLLFVAPPSDQSAIGRLIGGQAANSATDIRLTVISKSLAIGLDHPLTGVGFDRVFDSHSAPAQFLQAGGIVALASFALWAFGFGRLGVRLSRNPRVPAFSSELAAALLAGLMAWLVAGIVNPQIAERFMYVPAGVLLGLGLAAARLSRSAERPRAEIQLDFSDAQPVAAAGMPPEPEKSPPAHPAPVSR
jgi:hypothetical protein